MKWPEGIKIPRSPPPRETRHNGLRAHPGSQGHRVLLTGLMPAAAEEAEVTEGHFSIDRPTTKMASVWPIPTQKLFPTFTYSFSLFFFPFIPKVHSDIHLQSTLLFTPSFRSTYRALTPSTVCLNWEGKKPPPGQHSCVQTSLHGVSVRCGSPLSAQNYTRSSTPWSTANKQTNKNQIMSTHRELPVGNRKHKQYKAMSSERKTEMA